MSDADSPPGESSGRTRAWIVLVAVIAVAAGFWWLRDFMPPSIETLGDRADGVSGVVEVVVEEPGGDDDIPFSRAENGILLTMEGDTARADVEQALHAWDDDIDDGDVGFVDLRMRGTGARLALGHGTKAGDALVDELFEALADDHVLSYVNEASVDGGYVYVEIEPTSMADVVAYADRYGDAGPVASVTVGSGGIGVTRDEQWGAESLALVHRREKVAVRLDREYNFDGIDVYDRSPLVVRDADPAVRAAAKRALARVPTAEIGDYRVDTCQVPPDREPGGPPLCTPRD